MTTKRTPAAKKKFAGSPTKSTAANRSASVLAGKSATKRVAKKAATNRGAVAEALGLQRLRLAQGVHQLVSQSAERRPLEPAARAASGGASLLGLAGGLGRLKFAAKKAGASTSKVAAKKAGAPKAAPQAEPASVELAGNLRQLQARLQLLRFQREASLSPDTVVLRPGAGAADNSLEVATVSAIREGDLSRLKPAVEGPRTAPREARIDVLRTLDGSLAVKARPADINAIRRTSPGLTIFPATYAYPQRILPLGEELAGAEIQVQPGTKVKKFAVRVQDEAGQPVAGVTVRVLVDWDGAHMSATSDAQGLAQFGLPVVYPEVAVIMVEPEHTYWPLYLNGFQRAHAPKTATATMRRLLPDAFKLFEQYAPYDENAGQGVIVGVIDSGVGPHADLTVADGACFVTGEKSTDYQDNGIGHGTHVAGIIAAKRSDGGTYGVAPAVRLLSYRVCPKTGNKGRASSIDIAAAIEKAIADGCDLINISLGSVEAMPEIPEMLEKARSAGVVIFAATGNDSQPLLRYPARYSLALAVGALGRDKAFPDDCPASTSESEVRVKSEWVAEFSNYGVGTDFIGPGVAVLSTFPGSRYAMMSGTSMATPFTTGMAARLLSARPDLLTMPKGAPDGQARFNAIVSMLQENTRKLGWPDVYGSGVLM